MKKVLLSLSMLAATAFAANAQSILVGIGANDDVANVVEYNNTTNNSGIYWWSSACFPQFPNFNAASTSPVITDGVKRREGGVLTVSIDKTQTTNSGTSDCNGANAGYVPFGLNFGDDNGATAGGAAYYIDITSLKTFSCKIKASADVVVRMQVEDLNGKKLEATASNAEYSTTATTTFATWTVDLTGGVALDWSDATCGPPAVKPCQITGFDYTKVTKVMFFVEPGSNTFVGTVTLDDIKIGKASNVSLSTSSAAANIASTKVFPNPTTGEFTAEVSLVNNANVSIIVTDMMGKQVASKVATNGSASFETAGLAKGMYTVTYVLDGTPAKTELVVVK